jgi:hypothetical protein
MKNWEGTLMNEKWKVGKALEEGKGVLRLAPVWVPRSFCRPGKRIKLHPEDYYVLGLERGGIDERWLASTTHADNGPDTPEDEGMSYVVCGNEITDQVLLRDAIALMGDSIIGKSLWKKYGKWPMFSKFFDNQGPLPHHVHHRDSHAALVGQAGKPEMYFFPSQMNNHPGEFAFTYFGFNPDTTKEQVRQCLENFHMGDNKLLELSRCYKLGLDTGWDVPPGILHAPGSLCTYEPQFASDVYAMYQSILIGGQCVPVSLLWKDTPADRVGDYDYLMDVIDWKMNLDPDFHRNRFMEPKPVSDIREMTQEGYLEEWICYKCPQVGAKRLTVLPGRSVQIKDQAALGFILLQGYGKFGVWDIETPVLIRYGQQTRDEFFVTEDAARDGILVQNCSDTEPIVMLMHFADHPDLPLEG